MFKRSSYLRLADVEKIVWIQTSFLGDIILTTAAMNLVKQLNPAVKQILVTTPIGRSALQGEGVIDKFLVYEKRRAKGLLGLWRLAKSIDNECSNSKSIVMQPHRSTRSSLLAAMIRLPVVTYHESSCSFLADYRVSRVTVLHEAVRVGLLLEALDVPREVISTVMPKLSNGALRPGTQPDKIEGEVVIGVAAGSVWATKRWPVERYSALIKLLLQALPRSRIVLLGGPEERVLAESILSDNFDQKSRITNTVGKTSLLDLKGIYPTLSLLVSNDSSPIHYASAYQVPTVAIFGATCSQMGFGPMAANSSVVEVDLSCRPCSDHGPKRCPLQHFKCMMTISEEDVLAQCLKQLNS